MTYTVAIVSRRSYDDPDSGLQIDSTCGHKHKTQKAAQCCRAQLLDGEWHRSIIVENKE